MKNTVKFYQQKVNKINIKREVLFATFSFDDNSSITKCTILVEDRIISEGFSIKNPEDELKTS